MNVTVYCRDWSPSKDKTPHHLFSLGLLQQHHNAFLTPFIVRSDDLQRPLASFASLAHFSQLITQMAAADTGQDLAGRQREVKGRFSGSVLYRPGLDRDFDSRTQRQ